MAGTVITVGSRAADNYTTRAYDEDTGELLWSVDHGGQVNCVCVDGDGNIYTGGARVSSKTIRKYSIFGDLIWSADDVVATSGINGIAVDSNGNVYTCGGAYVKKFDSDGTEITTGWPYNHGATLRGICIDSSDNIYFTGSSASGITTRKLDSSGSSQWTFDGDMDDTLGIALVGTDVYVVGTKRSGGDRTVSILSQSTGSESSYLDHGSIIRGVTNNSTGDHTGDRSSSITTWISSTTVDHGANTLCICHNSDSGNVYIGGVLTSSITTRKYSSSGTEITDNDWPLNHTTSVRGIAWTPVVPFYGINSPGLLINVSCGLPILNYTNSTPALSLALSLGIPTFSGISQPPDIYAIEYPQQIIYRLYVSGAPLVELPFSSFQCRRSLGQSTFLTIVIPTYSTVLIDLLEARKTANSFLIIYSGYVDSNGQETLGEFLKSTIIDIRVERNFSSGTITIYGRVVPVSFTTQSRSLHQISKRGKTESGKKTATCAVDFNLRPNDTAVDGLSSWTVGDITLFVGSDTSYMLVTEN